MQLFLLHTSNISNNIYCSRWKGVISAYTVCPTRYRTWHFFNNSNTNEDIATKFEQEYVRCVRNEEECVCSVCVVRLIVATRSSGPPASQGSVASGTHRISYQAYCAW